MARQMCNYDQRKNAAVIHSKDFGESYLWISNGKKSSDGDIPYISGH